MISCGIILLLEVAVNKIEPEENMDRKTQVKICLDEIEASYRNMQKKKASENGMSKNRGWVRKHKDILKDLKYKGKIPRKLSGT